ncbi:ATP-grasp domain-containing protein [Cellulomonas iranensis]|uniref:ATP-grasp domain-containing protein n=1 Tax=Cellulomonas iranensis TaxID=76862 RepID=A0ABU0GH00_9CELL|nr:ATP-grasp domain-containing protein [Cellulomonas iranensis]MDQ0424640.1 hypothetical protein [Cellulomonas iranensis]
MTTLVLNRFQLSRTDYRAWAGDEPLVLVTSAAGLAGSPTPEGYLHVEVVDDYEGPHVELVAHRLHGHHAFSRVLAMSEWDLVRAGRLRDAWGLPGPGEHDALLFRDKVAMKVALAGAGVPVARWRQVDDPTDLRRAADELGYPFVLKPRRGAASVGVDVVRGEADLLRCATGARLGVGDVPADLVAEEFVSNDLLHVDGIVHAGDVVLSWPTAQSASCLDITHGRAQVSVHLDDDDPALSGIQDLTARALHALGVPSSSLFHAEVFDVGGELVVNEVAARVGGAKIRDQMIRAFDVDPVEWHVRDVMGGPVPPLPEAPARRAGYALVPTRAGTITRLDDLDLPGSIVLADVPHAVGDVLAAPAATTSALASFVCVGTRRSRVADDLHRVVGDFEASIVVEPAEAVGA